MQEQRETPLWSAVAKHRAQSLYPYHVPAHKAGRGLLPSFAAHMAEFDLTELPGLDNLAAPDGPLADAEALAATFVGADATYFTTNGSTAGILASVLAVAPPGSTIILPETAHQSFHSACVLGDLSPVFLPVELYPELALPMGYTLSSLRKSLAECRPSLVVATTPTYHGVCSDSAAIKAVCREHGVPLLVDEAHGTHLLVSDTQVQSAVRSGADLVVQSMHKTGGALTGAAWVHCFNPHFREPLKRALRLVQSTSPSYLLLTSLDLARRTLAIEGAARFCSSRGHADKLRALLPAVSFPRDWQQDPLRIVIDARYFDMSGFALQQIMLAYGLSPEMADAYTVTLVIGLFESAEGLPRAAALARDLPRTTVIPKAQLVPYLSGGRLQMLTPRQAYFSQSIRVPLARARGEICAEPLVPYPPGVPLLWPGQRIEHEDISYLQALLAAGGNCIGVSPTGQILVIAGEDCE
ncbi:MAG: Arginine decarboxylase [Firmicutes bacterium]|nr:Arginine decarboxylase [Bacillota bacterium]